MSTRQVITIVLVETADGNWQTFYSPTGTLTALGAPSRYITNAMKNAAKAWLAARPENEEIPFEEVQNIARHS